MSQQETTPEVRERELVWGILLALRAKGVEELDNTGGALHTAFSRLLEDESNTVQGAVGFVPKPHVLLNEYRCIVEALDRAHRDGMVSFKNSTYRKLNLTMSDTVAKTMLGRSVLGDAAQSLADVFWNHYESVAG